ncbi:MAG: hypothetical protein ACW981_18705 [Candidatus Hodarchaeales archaeon]|jgi:hypothetical protein
MNTDLKFNKKNVSKLSSYIAAILDWKENDLHFLPCIDGYLVTNTRKKVLIWIHKHTIEATFSVIYDLTKETVEELLYSLIIGGSIIKEVVKSKYPDPPKLTLFFVPKLYSLEYGNVVITDPDGKLGSTLDFLNRTMASISSIVTSTGEGISRLIKKEREEEKGQVNKKKTQNKDIDEESDRHSKPIVYIQVMDSLYYHLSKEQKFKGVLPPSSGGYEFRTVFIDEAAKFLKNLQDKGDFSLKYQGVKKILF